MRLNSVLRWLAILPLAILVLTTVGCSGIAAAGSISPLQFLLPGFIQNQPKPTPDAPRSTELAAANPATEAGRPH